MKTLSLLIFISISFFVMDVSGKNVSMIFSSSPLISIDVKERYAAEEFKNKNIEDFIKVRVLKGLKKKFVEHIEIDSFKVLEAEVCSSFKYKKLDKGITFWPTLTDSTSLVLKNNVDHLIIIDKFRIENGAILKNTIHTDDVNDQFEETILFARWRAVYINLENNEAQYFGNYEAQEAFIKLSEKDVIRLVDKIAERIIKNKF